MADICRNCGEPLSVLTDKNASSGLCNPCYAKDLAEKEATGKPVTKPKSEKAGVPSPNEPPKKSTIIWAYICLAVICISGSALSGILIPGLSTPVMDQSIPPVMLVAFFFGAGALIGFCFNGQAIRFLLKRGQSRWRALSPLLIFAAISIVIFNYEYRATETEAQRLTKAGAGPPKPLFSDVSPTTWKIIGVLLFLSIPQFFSKKQSNDAKP